MAPVVNRIKIEEATDPEPAPPEPQASLAGPFLKHVRQVYRCLKKLPNGQEIWGWEKL